MALTKITSTNIGANAVTSSALSNTALISALGYTPANKAGETFTNNINIGYDGYPSLKYKNAAGTDKAEIYVGTSAGDLNIIVNSNQAMAVDSSGRAAFPQNSLIYFKYGFGTQNFTTTRRFCSTQMTITTSGRDIVNSSYFNTTNGRFTAPIAGTYVFGVTIMRDGGTSTGPVDFQIVKNEPNATGQNSESTYGRGYQGSYSASYEQITIVVPIKLSINDYVALDFTGSMSIYNDDSWFYGYFVG